MGQQIDSTQWCLYSPVCEGFFIKPGVSFIIPTFQNVSGLENVIESFQMFTIPFEFEVLVVANLEDIRVRQVTDKFFFSRYLSVGSVGVNKARNLGLVHASYEFSYFFDDDCLVEDPEFFLSLYKQLQSLNVQKCFIGGSYQVQSARGSIDLAYFEIQKRWLASGLLDANNRCVFLLGGNFGGRTSELRSCLFDPDIVFGGSETEFFLRLHRIGFICQLLPQLSVQHQTSLQPHSLVLKAYKQGRGAAYIRGKSLGFQSHYLRSQDPLPRSSEVRFWMNIYSVVFKLSLFLHLSGKLQSDLLIRWIKNLLIKPELARKNLISRFIALVGIHLKSKK